MASTARPNRRSSSRAHATSIDASAIGWCQKEDLLADVWGTPVRQLDAAVTSRIKSARQAIGDSGREQAIHPHDPRSRLPVRGRDSTWRTRRRPPPPGRTPERAARQAPTDPAPGTRRHVDEGWPLVGRDVELRDRIARPRRSNGVRGGVLLTGPAGAGQDPPGPRRDRDSSPQRGVRAVARIHGHTRGTSSRAAQPRSPTCCPPTSSDDRRRCTVRWHSTVLLQRARAAIQSTSPTGNRLVLMIDDVDRVDGTVADVCSARSMGERRSIFARDDTTRRRPATTWRWPTSIEQWRTSSTTRRRPRSRTIR